MSTCPSAVIYTVAAKNEPLATVEIPVLPVKTIEDLKLYEELLSKDLEQFFKLKLVRYVKQIGGSTLSDCVKRAWESVLTLEVRAFVNWNEGIAFKNASQAALEFETEKALKNFATVLKNKQLGFEMESSESNDYHGVQENRLLHQSKFVIGQYLAADVPNHLSALPTSTHDYCECRRAASD
ncbi:hypothetical protein DAPPUDRAFT_261662 [Daphnia pulex]|uniref:DUF4806 domain-containing protein n=1 Tax=Daphnia pulex TaxID=6669 RepID=E9HLE6_DAPPU|nr:hypothetical protein DAPPUDRAFT_261662 [Daphnia pulex]|eukprot:EFX67424.1 hypothetical protein DAPPUDRAFT_261662 [Daphnia pulex]